MKIHTFILALGALVGATAVAQAQSASPPAGPLEAGQKAFGDIVGANFAVPDQAAAVVAPGAAAALGPSLGGVLRTSLEIPGGVFAGIMKPFADADAAANPAPAAAPAPARHRRHARRRNPAIG